MKPADLTALKELESRISALEKRLKNANATRDFYLDFLRTKYPSWNPSISTYIRNRVNTSHLFERNEYIFNRLATSDYHWDWSANDLGYLPRKTQNIEKNPPLYFDIPKSGPLLNTDLQRTRRRLNEISQQLKIMRDTRLSLPSNDYIRNKMLKNETYDNDDFLSNARKRLADMTVTLPEPTVSPTREQIDGFKMKEQHEILVTDIRAGRLPTEIELPYGQPEINSLIPPSSEVKKAPIEEPSEITSPLSKTSDPKPEDHKDAIKITGAHKQENVPLQTSIDPINNEAPVPATKSYATMLSMLENKDITSDSDDDSPIVSSLPPNQKTAPQKKILPSAASALFSQYLRPNINTKESSSSDDVIVKPIPEDSDSDFFD